MEFVHEEWLVAVDAYAADAQGVHEKVARRAVTDADETFATTGAFVDGVRGPVGRSWL